MNQNNQENLTTEERLELEILRIVADDELTEEEKAKRLLDIFKKELAQHDHD